MTTTPSTAESHAATHGIPPCRLRLLLPYTVDTLRPLVDACMKRYPAVHIAVRCATSQGGNNVMLRFRHREDDTADDDHGDDDGDGDDTADDDDEYSSDMPQHDIARKTHTPTPNNATLIRDPKTRRLTPRTWAVVEAFNGFLNEDVAGLVDAVGDKRLMNINGHATVPVVSRHTTALETTASVDVNTFESTLDRIRREQPVLHERIIEALAVINDAFDRYGGGHGDDHPSGLACSFNGGKDCTVLVHLLDHVRRKRRVLNASNSVQNAPTSVPNASTSITPMPTVFITQPNGFAQVEAFTDQCARDYGLDVERIEAAMKEGLAKFVQGRPDVRAVFVGTRRTDPYCAHLQHFSRTDPGWPDFMRVNPIIDWQYADVWAYLRIFNVSYCVLYDRGYSSLGARTNTLPNDHLSNARAPFGYDPAYMLHDVDGKRERAGRPN